MATVLFDFDSTVIINESLEEILAPKCAAVPGLAEKIAHITDLGMSGKLNFRESLAQRLALAAPHRDEVRAFGENAKPLFTKGIPELIAKLHRQGICVKIVSGGLYEAIVPAAIQLGISSQNVHAVRLSWNQDGSFSGIDPKDLFSVSKAEGVAALLDNWNNPLFAIGDGKTDHDLFRLGLVSQFVAFTANVRRPAVVALGAPEARDSCELTTLLEEWL